MPIADETDSRSDLIVDNAIENKICRAVATAAGRDVGVAGENAAVIEGAQESEVGGVEIVLLVASRLHADGKEVAPALPGEVVVVVEGVVAKNLRVGVGAEVAGVVVEALSGKTGIELSAGEWNADFLVTRQAEVPDGSVGMLLSQRTRVKPKRASLTIVGEKVCTQLPPPTCVG